MKRAIVLAVILTLAPGLAAAEFKKRGAFQTIASYFADIPLGTTTKDQVYQVLGTPTTQMTTGDKELWVYKTGTKVRAPSYTYEFIDGKLVDVRWDALGTPGKPAAARDIQARQGRSQ